MAILRTKQHKRLAAALAAALVAARKARGITQTELARRLRLTQTWVARVESDRRRIDVVEFLRVARSLGFDPVRMITLLTKDKT